MGLIKYFYLFVITPFIPPSLNNVGDRLGSLYALFSPTAITINISESCELWVIVKAACI